MSKLREQVAEFHRVFEHPCVDRPSIPPDERVRFRLRFIVEEVFEALEATFGKDDRLDNAASHLESLIEERSISVDLPTLADAFADIDYVVEGARLEFGINGDPIADEVHRANMAKLTYEKCAAKGCGAPNCGQWNRVGEYLHRYALRRADGKTLKPADWRPPDIAGELRKQGWTPSAEAKLARIAEIVDAWDHLACNDVELLHRICEALK
jgi:predicted HAD superfamily Cof-like phosphohydrolase